MTGKSFDYRKKAANYDAAGEGVHQEIWRDGLYSIEFYFRADEDEPVGEALAVVREGTILGSDKFGGVFEGRIVGKPDGAASLSLMVRIPPGGVLVTGGRVGGQEAVLDVVGELSRNGDLLTGFCDLEGARMILRFNYIGLLPQ